MADQEWCLNCNNYIQRSGYPIYSHHWVHKTGNIQCNGLVYSKHGPFAEPGTPLAKLLQEQEDSDGRRTE